jgi:protein-tyrosine-phosphatase
MLLKDNFLLLCMKSILFVCIENSNRSQMAQAFAILHGQGKIDAYSAGSQPSGQINPKAVEAMKELGYDLTRHESKSLSEIPDLPYDAVITMGCGDACPWVNATLREDWSIPDPRNMDKTEFRDVRNLIENKVKTLLENLLSEK